MTIVRKAKKEDFDLIYPLLLKFNNPLYNKEDWRKLFIKYWDNEEDFFGFLLLEDNEAIGFFGLVFSHRYINNKKYKFANFTSWFVKEEYRTKSMLMVFEILKLKEYVLTDFTPSNLAYDSFY